MMLVVLVLLLGSCEAVASLKHVNKISGIFKQCHIILEKNLSIAYLCSCVDLFTIVVCSEMNVTKIWMLQYFVQ